MEMLQGLIYNVLFMLGLPVVGGAVGVVGIAQGFSKIIEVIYYSGLDKLWQLIQ